MKSLQDRYKRVAVEVHCPVHKISRVIYQPDEEMPVCPKCGKKMIIKEVLTEGKY